MGFVNEQVIESPLENWPGHIVVPVEVSAADFATYWRKVQGQQDDGDEQHATLLAWQARFHLVKDWKIEGLKTADLDESGLKVPSIKLIVWVVKVLNELIMRSMSLPNLLAPSSDAERLNATART